jgi:hypothetical protein
LDPKETVGSEVDIREEVDAELASAEETVSNCWWDLPWLSKKLSFSLLLPHLPSYLFFL